MGLLNFLQRKKPGKPRSVHVFSNDITEGRKLEELVGQFSPSQQRLQDLACLIIRRWEREEADKAIKILQQFGKEHGDAHSLVYSFLTKAIAAKVFDHFENTGSFLVLTQAEPSLGLTRSYNLQLIVDSVKKIEKQEPPPRWIYDIFGNWFGNEDPRKNSVRFPLDVVESVKPLSTASQMSRNSRDFFRKVVNGFVPEEESYGSFTARLAENIQQLPGTARAFSHCAAIYNICPKAAPELYGALLSLPRKIPANIDQFIHRAITVLPQQEMWEEYLQNLQEIIEYLNRLLVTEDQEGLGQLFGNKKFEAERALRALKHKRRVLRTYSEGRISVDPQLRTLRGLIARMEAVGSDVDAIIYSHSSNFAGNYRQIIYDGMINNMRDGLSPAELGWFATLLYRDLTGESLKVAEQRALESYVARAMFEDTARRRNKGRVTAIIKEQRSQRKEVPLHVKEAYNKAFSNVHLQPDLINIGEDNGAWYDHIDQVEQYLSAQDLHTRSRFLNKVTGFLIRKGYVFSKEIGIAGLACGDAWGEIELVRMLQEQGRLSHSPHLYLFDKSYAMLRKAAMNCYRKGIQASADLKDVTRLSYRSDFHIESPQRQLLISLLGRTFYNLEKAADDVLERIVEVTSEHRQQQVQMNVPISPTIVLIEGDREKNMDYYQDPGSENMHWLYITSRLNTHRDAFAIDDCSTYLPLLREDGKKVEFYFLATREIVFSDEDITEIRIPKGQVIRVGESSTLQPETIEQFERAGFMYEEVFHKKRVMSIL